MHEFGCAHDVAAVDLTDALMAEAHAKHGNATSEGRNHRVRQAGIFRSTGARADENAVGREFLDLVDRERVAAMNEWIGSQLAEILDEIEDERVVVIEDKDAGGHRRRTLSAGAGRA